MVESHSFVCLRSKRVSLCSYTNVSKVRVFRREEVLSEITEADRVTHLKSLDGERRVAADEEEGAVGTKWAYGLANGEVFARNISPKYTARIDHAFGYCGIPQDVRAHMKEIVVVSATKQ